MTSKLRSILVFVVLLLALGIVTQAMAQGTVTKTPPLEREATGAVSALTTTTITINGRVFDIAQAEISATISVGTVVKVHYSVALDGTLVAREVRPAARQVNTGNNGVDDANDDNGQDNVLTHDVNDDHGQDSGSNRGSDNHGANSGHGGDSGQDDSGHHGGGHD